MKTIGIIGGMSWESSKFYYEYINRLVVEKLGGSHSARILMSSVDFAEIETLSFEDNWEKIGTIMATEAKRLESAGADIILLATNTIHLVAKYIEDAVSIPFLHIAKAAGRAIKEKGISNIGLLGTQFTMERDFYTKILTNEFGIEVFTPELKNREKLQSIIYNQLVKGIFTEASKNICLEMIQELKKNGSEGIILGCTELPILIPADEISIPSFNTTMIHSLAAVEFAIS